MCGVCLPDVGVSSRREGGQGKEGEGARIKFPRVHPELLIKVWIKVWIKGSGEPFQEGSGYSWTLDKDAIKCEIC